MSGVTRPIGRIMAQTGPKGQGEGGYWFEIGALLLRDDGMYFVSLRSLPISPLWDGFCQVWSLRDNERLGQRGGVRKGKGPSVSTPDMGGAGDDSVSD